MTFMQLEARPLPQSYTIAVGKCNERTYIDVLQNGTCQPATRIYGLDYRADPKF
jgi:hypothetical protein